LQHVVQRLQRLWDHGTKLKCEDQRKSHEIWVSGILMWSSDPLLGSPKIPSFSTSGVLCWMGKFHHRSTHQRFDPKSLQTWAEVGMAQNMNIYWSIMWIHWPRHADRADSVRSAVAIQNKSEGEGFCLEVSHRQNLCLGRLCGEWKLQRIKCNSLLTPLLYNNPYITQTHYIIMRCVYIHVKKQKQAFVLYIISVIHTLW
jgi:hypothetical protein